MGEGVHQDGGGRTEGDGDERTKGTCKYGGDSQRTINDQSNKSMPSLLMEERGKELQGTLNE